MQVFIAQGRVSKIPEEQKELTASGKAQFTFDFACDTPLQDKEGKTLAFFSHVMTYGKQAVLMRDSLSKGSPLLIKGQMIERPYINADGEKRSYRYILPDKIGGITFFETKAESEKRKESIASSKDVEEPVLEEEVYSFPNEDDFPF